MWGGGESGKAPRPSKNQVKVRGGKESAGKKISTTTKKREEKRITKIETASRASRGAQYHIFTGQILRRAPKRGKRRWAMGEKKKLPLGRSPWN